MGKIKKILENELVGGTQSTDVYPVTSVKAVYDEDNERLDNIIRRRGVVNISTNYNSDHIAEVLTLEQAIAKVPSADKVLGFKGTFLTSSGWRTYQFNGSSIKYWGNVDNWDIEIDSNQVNQELGDSTNTPVSQKIVSYNLKTLLNLSSFSLNSQISNLFDKNSPTQFTEKFSWNGPTDYYYSDFMPVAGLNKIYSNIGAGGGWWRFYDANGNVLNEGDNQGHHELDVPKDAVALRILCIASEIENTKNKGVVVPYPNYKEGQPYGFTTPSDKIREFGARQTQAQSKGLYGAFSHLGITHNLLANVKRFADYQFNPSGAIEVIVGTDFPISDFIAIKSDTKYKFCSVGHIAWYDESKKLISVQTSVNSNIITSPTNAAYLRVCGGWGVFEYDEYFKKHRTDLISQYLTKGQRPVFIPAFGGMFIEGTILNLRGIFFYLGNYYDMRQSLSDGGTLSVDRCKVDLIKATTQPGYVAYLLFDPTKIYGKGYVFLCNYDEISSYTEAVIWKGVVFDSTNKRFYIDEFDGSLALSRFEGRKEFGKELSETVNDWSYENLIDYTQFVDSNIAYPNLEGTFYKIIKNIPCQEETWYWGWSTGYVEVFNNQDLALNIYHIQSNGKGGLAFKTPKGAHHLSIYSAPVESINQVRLVMGKSIVDYSPYGKRVYKDPYKINPYWFDMINSMYWVNQVSSNGFTNKFDNEYNYQIWVPTAGKTYIGNSKGYQAECYNASGDLIHRFAESDKVFTVPEGTAYCKTYTRVGTESAVMIIPGTELPPTYIPYGERVSKSDANAIVYYLNGRKYCGLGDSITDGDGNGSVSWYDYLLKRLHADSSSLNFAETGQCLRTMADRCTAENMQNVSKVFIMGGTNKMSHFSIGTIDDKPTPDLIESNRTYTVGERVLGGPKEKHGWTTPIYAYTVIYECTIKGNTGEVSDDFITTMPTTAEQTIQVGTATFKVIGYPTWYADMWRIVDRVWGFNNKCEIIWLVPIKTTSDVGKPASQWERKDKFQAVRDFCEYNSIRYIDLQKEFPLNSYTKDSIMSDSLHPNKTGHEIICDIVMSHI